MGYLNAYIDAVKHEEKDAKIDIEEEIRKRVIVSEERLKEPYVKTRDNIRISELLRIEINKDLTEGKPIASILDKALKCISLMTTDELFYKENSTKLLKYIGEEGAAICER